MKVCLVSREFPPDQSSGGIGTYTHHTSRALAARGHEVHVITETTRRPIVETSEGVVIHRLAAPSAPLKELRVFQRARAVAREVASLGSLDIIQASEYGAEAWGLTRKRSAPLITRLATPRYLIDEIEGNRSLRMRFGIDRMERQQTLRSSHVISSTHALANRVSKEWSIPKRHISVIPNALDLEGIRRLGQGSRPSPPPPGARYILYFGRLEERKGVHHLARALRWVLRDHHGVWAVFVGADRPFQGDSMRAHVKRELADYRDRLVVKEQLAPARLLPLVAGATLVVLPSIWEAFGFVCLEAMALSVPVVATSGSGFAEIIDDGVSGQLVTPNDPTTLAMVITMLLRDQVELRRLARGGRLRAEAFGVDTVCSRLEDLYHRLGAPAANRGSPAPPEASSGR